MSLPTRSAPATSLSISRRLARAAAEFLPPFAIALLILPFIIQYGKLVPWQPSTIDLQVYVYAVKDMLAGKDIFATTTPFWNLYFIYPPIAAILMTPLAFGPYLFWQVVWTGALVWAQQSVLKRCGAMPAQSRGQPGHRGVPQRPVHVRGHVEEPSARRWLERRVAHHREEAPVPRVPSAIVPALHPLRVDRAVNDESRLV